MNRFVVVLVALFSVVLTGCGTIIEATKSSFSQIRVSSPIVRQSGFREETHRIIARNPLHLVGSLFVNGNPTDVRLYPNGSINFVSKFEPHRNAKVSMIFVFKDENKKYAGHVKKVFDAGHFARSESWTIFAQDVIYGGQRLAESEDAPEFQSSTQTVRLPREWFSGTAILAVINDIPDNKAEITTNGEERMSLVAGEIYVVKTKNFSSSSRWGGPQPVLVQADVWDKQYTGYREWKLTPSSFGVHSRVEAISPNSLRRR